MTCAPQDRKRGAQREVEEMQLRVEELEVANETLRMRQRSLIKSMETAEAHIGMLFNDQVFSLLPATCTTGVVTAKLAASGIKLNRKATFLQSCCRSTPGRLPCKACTVLYCLHQSTWMPMASASEPNMPVGQR